MSAVLPPKFTDRELKRRNLVNDQAVRGTDGLTSVVIDSGSEPSAGRNDAGAANVPLVESAVPFFLVAFKICMDEDDHWMNKMAIWGTSSAADNAMNYEGTVSHAEIMFQHKVPKGMEKRWYRYSIMKTRGVQARSGKITWNPGKVHSIPSTVDSMKKYRFFKVEVSADGADRALRFLNKQVDTPFNFAGYALNFIMPFKIGVRNFQQAMRRKTNTWFCSELVVCAFQAAGVREMELMKACAVSPNELYRIVLNSDVGQPVEFGAYQHI
jgi:hypothetical protein